MKLIKKHILTVALVMASALTVTATKPATPPDSTKGMNALDYVLQRPLYNTTFDSITTFNDRLYFSGGIGLDWVGKSSDRRRVAGNGVTAEIRGGYRFTPAHALQLTLGVGRHYLVKHEPIYLNLAADWNINLSALTNHRDPSNKFEFWASVGVEGQMLRRYGQWDYSVGGRVGFQARYYPTPRTYFFVEPRFGIYSDQIDGIRSMYRYDWGAQLMVGLGYRMRSGLWRNAEKDQEEFNTDNFSDNMYYGASGGAIVNLSNSYGDIRDNFGPNASIFVGKMFKPAHGLRLDVTFGHDYNYGPKTKNYWMIDADYVWDITRTVAGYDPDAIFNTQLAFGPSLGFSQGRNPYVGVDASLQARWNITPNWGVFIEPRVRLYPGKFCDQADCARPADIYTSLNIGLQYTLNSKFNSGRYFYNPSEAYEEWLENKSGFISLAAGMMYRESSWAHHQALGFGLGRWFSPLLAWRAGLEFENSTLPYRSWIAAASGDLMLDLTTLTLGYNPDRIFRLAPLVGVQLGGTHYASENYFTAGLKFGGQLSLRLHPNLEFFVEPQFVNWRMPNYGKYSTTPEWRIMAGFSYRIGGTESDSQLPQERRNFVFLKGGPAWSSEYLALGIRNRIVPTFTAGLGHWFNKTSGARLGISYDQLGTINYKASKNKVYSLKADYMLNLNRLAKSDSDDNFRIIALAGAGLGFSNSSDDRIGWALNGAVQLNYRLNKNLDVFVEPEVTIWDKNVTRDYAFSKHFVGSASISAGVNYFFDF